MAKMLPEIVGDKHAYTRSKAPWRLDAYREAKGATSGGMKFGWRLFHYLSGWGLKIFGRTIRQEEADMKRTRFLVAFGIGALVWFYFFVF